MPLLKISKNRPVGLKQFEIFQLRHLLNFSVNAQCRFKNRPRPLASLEPFSKASFWYPFSAKIPLQRGKQLFTKVSNMTES
jgi:hypothetical protein